GRRTRAWVARSPLRWRVRGPACGRSERTTCARRFRRWRRKQPSPRLAAMPEGRGRVLIIAGSDSGGGAGIQADIKTVTALGGYAATAVTSVTVQNTQGVSAVHPIPT